MEVEACRRGNADKLRRTAENELEDLREQMDKIMHKAGVKAEEMVTHPEPVKPPPIIVGIFI